MKSAKVALALVVLCAPALAVDGDPAKPAPAPAPAPAPSDGTKTEPKAPAAPAAKKERKVDPAAEAALKKYSGLVLVPGSAGVKTISGRGEIEEGGEKVGMNPQWSAEKGFDLEIVLPESAKAAIAKQGQSEEETLKGQKAKLNMFLDLPAAFEVPGRDWSHYDVACKQSGDDQVVELTAFDDDADAESRTYTFGKDGLLKSTSIAPKVDENDPQGAMMAGITLDAEWGFEKKGEKSLLTSRTLTIMGQEIATKFGYYEGPNGCFLPKDVTITTVRGDQVFKFHDYTVDGKFVDATKAEAPKPAEKPAEKPADKPAGDPPPAPVPVPPAPKDEPK